MKKKSINLSAVGLKNIVINEEEKFKFIIGEKELEMSKFFAEFISLTVSHIHHFDPTIDSIDITECLKKKQKNENTEQKRKHNFEEVLQKLSTEHALSQILQLSEGQSIEIENATDLISLRYLSVLLNNLEMQEKIENMINESAKSDEELLEEIIFLREINLNDDVNIYFKLIDELSSRISNDNKTFIERIPKDILYLILHNENFKYDDYDTLFETINNIFSKERTTDEEEYCINSFYEQLDIKKLNKNNYEEFIKNLSYREITETIWSQLCTILLNNEQAKEKKEQISNKEQEYEFDGQPNHRFNGIIQHLRGYENKNICDLGIIGVTASSSNFNYPPKNVVDFFNNNYYLSEDGNAWIRYDFKEKKIRPTRYSIKTRIDSDAQNPVNWVIEVSETAQEDDWRIIDTRNGNKSVSQRNQIDTFDISTQLNNNEFYRYIRFRSTGNTSTNLKSFTYSNLAISSLEFFGFLIE